MDRRTVGSRSPASEERQGWIMKIMILGSMSFIKDIVKAQEELEGLGHEAFIPVGVGPHLKDKNFVNDLEANLDFVIKNNVMKRNFDLVAKNDAVLVINNRKNGVNGYIGASVLMEMAIAHHLNKKVFILNKIPHFREERWAHEIAIMKPIVINGDLAKIR